MTTVPLVIDLETSVKNRGEGAVGNFHASPFAKDNKIVCLGTSAVSKLTPTGMSTPKVFVTWGTTAGLDTYFLTGGGETIELVGHNIGFDLLYLLRYSTVVRNNLARIRIWDTQQVAYLLSGQLHKYPSLDECCIIEGLPEKPDKIKQYWLDGIDTEDIPAEELGDYLKHDVSSTEALYLLQKAALTEYPELEKLVHIKMNDILCTTLMEYNGMHFDLERAAALKDELLSKLNGISAGIAVWVAAADWPRSEVGFLPGSPADVSRILHGGTLKVKHRVPVMSDAGPTYYKTGPKAGTIKEKWVVADVRIKGFALPTKKAPKASGDYSVDDEALTELIKEWPTTAGAAMAALILEYREVSKDLSTYVEGYSSLVWPDNKIHPSFSHVATATGRQSCSKPNLQNVTKGDDA